MCKRASKAGGQLGLARNALARPRQPANDTRAVRLADDAIGQARAETVAASAHAVLRAGDNARDEIRRGAARAGSRRRRGGRGARGGAARRRGAIATPSSRTLPSEMRASGLGRLDPGAQACSGVGVVARRLGACDAIGGRAVAGWRGHA